MAALFIAIDLMPFLAPTLDNADPLFAQVTTPSFYVHHVEVADQYTQLVAIYMLKTSSYKFKKMRGFENLFRHRIGRI